MCLYILFINIFFPLHVVIVCLCISLNVFVAVVVVAVVVAVVVVVSLLNPQCNRNEIEDEQVEQEEQVDETIKEEGYKISSIVNIYIYIQSFSNIQPYSHPIMQPSNPHPISLTLTLILIKHIYQRCPITSPLYHILSTPYIIYIIYFIYISYIIYHMLYHICNAICYIMYAI